MADVQLGRTEVRQTKGRDDVPDTEEPNLRLRLEYLIAAGPLDPLLLNVVTEVERGGRAPAEPDDVDEVIAAHPVRAEVVIGFLDAGKLS